MPRRAGGIATHAGEMRGREVLCIARAGPAGTGLPEPPSLYSFDHSRPRATIAMPSRRIQRLLHGSLVGVLALVPSPANAQQKQRLASLNDALQASAVLNGRGAP